MTKELSQVIYGSHEPCPLDVMPDGWVLYIAEVGDSTVPHSGIDLSGEPRAVMIRIQWRFGDDGGCYPPPYLQAGFIQRVESLVRNTPDCHIWIGGNEPNIKTEGMFTHEETAVNYDAIWHAVHAQTGHEDDQVLFPPIGPWNTEIGYGWIEYFEVAISLCQTIDGFALHTYSRSANPADITASDKMGAPYDHLYSNFQTYKDWMNAIPRRYRDRPVYITEFDENDAWLNENTRIIQEAYREIDEWNQTLGNQQIRCLMLYRWPHHDKYYIEGKTNVIIDFMFAQDHGYTWKKEDVPMPERILYQSSFENGFYPQDGETHVMAPNGWSACWDEAFGKRPEFKPKDKEQGHTEVRTGRFAAGFFHVSTRFAGILFKQFTVTPNAPVRAEIWCMGVHSSGQSAGMSIGIFNTVDFFADDSHWIEWWSPNMGEYKDRVWKKIEASGTAGADGKFYVALLGRADEAIPDWNTHWDDVTVYVTDDSGPVDPPVDPPEGGIMDSVTAIRLYCNEIERAVANPILCIRVG